MQFHISFTQTRLIPLIKWIIVILFSFQLKAEFHPQFQHLVTDDGLANNATRKIFQDSHGYLWFGTLNGLSRYDGYHFTNYQTIAGDTTSISNNRISNIFEDHRNNLIILTFDGSVHYFNREKESFQNITQSPSLKGKMIEFTDLIQTSSSCVWGISKQNGCIRVTTPLKNDLPLIIKHLNTSNYLSNDTINFIFKHYDNSIWLGTQKGLAVLPSDQTSFSEIKRISPKNKITAMNFTVVDNEGETLFFGTHRNGLWRYSPENRQLTPLMDINNKVNCSIEALKVDISGKIIIGTRQQGLCIYTPSSKKVDVLTTNNSALPSNYITVITHNTDDQFWIQTEKRGLSLFKLDSKTVTYYPLKAEKREALAENDKPTIYRDSNHTTWLSLYGGGIARFNQDAETFDQFNKISNNPYSLSSDYVLTIFEDRSKNLWIGTYDGGVNKLNLNQYGFKKLLSNKLDQHSLENEVRSMYKTSKDAIFAGSKTGKIYKIEKDMKSNEFFIKYPEILKVPKSIYCFFEDKKGNLWIGTKGDGIYVVQNNNFDASKIVHLNNFDENIQCNDVFSIEQDHMGSIWIGTYGAGIFKLESPFFSSNIEIESIRSIANDSTSLSDNRVRQLLFDQSDNLWVATSKGLNFIPKNQLRAKQKKFLQILNHPTQPNSISNNEILSLLETDLGQIIVGTFGGGLNILNDVNAPQFSWQHYTTHEKLSSNVIRGILQDNNEHLWLSTDQGLTQFNLQTHESTIYHNYELSGIDNFSDATCLKSDDYLFFGHSDGLLFFNPHELSKDSTQYPINITKFKVNGKNVLLPKRIDNELIFNYEENTISINFAVLDFSAPEKITYSFFLENFDKEWNFNHKSNQAIYRGLPPGKYIFHARGTNSHGTWMNDRVKIAFTIAPPFWHSKLGVFVIIMLIAIALFIFIYLLNHQLSLKHTIKSNERINENKLTYYTNISHEFKTPLTLILSPIEDILQSKNLSDSLKEKAQLIKYNATYLLNLIEQILDFRKIREQSGQLSVSKINLVDFFRDIYYVFIPLATKKEIQLSFIANVNSAIGYIDNKHLEKICFNLLSNALKHTPPNKKIDFIIDIDTHTEKLRIQIKDEGEGIAKDELNKIFDRFYKSKDSSGIGLFYTKELVNHHKGSIIIESNLGQGATFTVEIPISEKAYATHEVQSGDQISIPDLQMAKQATTLSEDLPLTNDIYRQPFEAKTVLIIEDNNTMRQYLVSKFQKRFKILEAINGVEALSVLENETPDIVLCDLLMPEMDGIEFLKTFRKQTYYAHVPIILLSAITNEEKITEALKLGADDFITKPFNINILLSKIENLIAQRHKLMSKYKESDTNVSSNAMKHQDEHYLLMITKIIEDNIQKSDFTVETIAMELGISRSAFYKRMKDISGYAPNEYIQMVRMKKAAKLLKETRKTVAMISREIGFSDPNYFTKCFKSHFGETPKTYSKKNQQL